MAKISRWLPLTALAGLAIGGGLWLGLAGPREEPAALPATADAPRPGGTDAQIAGSLADDIKRAELLQRPEVLDYQARLTFAGDYQIFIKSAAELSEEERRERAAALAKEIDRREAAGELALSEALLMQAGLVQAEGGDEAAQKARADALLARYQALSAAREAQAKAPDARFSRYKSEEKRIVDEVMALDSIPDGLSRDQYLRQRLQEAREQAYQ
jgi:hypothetical protein